MIYFIYVYMNAGVNGLIKNYINRRQFSPYRQMDYGLEAPSASGVSGPREPKSVSNAKGKQI